MASKLVSVIIPCFNASATIRKAVDSALAQSYRNLEVIVIDDGSGDRLDQVLGSYIKNNKIKFFRQTNRGQGAARNLGAQHAKGEVLAFLDSDDEWMVNKLKLQLPLLTGRVGLVHSEAIYLRGDDELGWFYRDICKRQPIKGWVYEALLDENWVVNSSVVVARRAFFDSGGFDESGILRTTEDYDLWLRISRKFQFDYVEKPLVRYWTKKPSRSDIKRVRRALARIYAKNLKSAPWRKKLYLVNKIVRYGWL